MEFNSDTKVKEIEDLAQEFFEKVIRDEEPIFVSDEATIWDGSMAAPEELLRSCSDYYRVTVFMDDLKLPLWELIPSLDERRRQIAR
ncbi:MAG: hypothetical protein M3Y57_18970 [Acidobacteriota bacterium]|nr:hypothetical protein [Acidobacteriota bacterium]